MNKKSSFFSNKACDICKRQATIMRFYNGRVHVLCEKQKCDKISRIKLGLFGMKLNLKG